MEIGIGLPNAVPGTSGEQLLEWARRSEGRGFSTLGTIDRVTYSNYEPLVALSAAAAVTERINLMTTVLLAPLRGEGTIFGKQALSVNALSGGRLVLGLGLGPREDDFLAVGADMRTRGRDMEAFLTRLTEVWADETIGPDAPAPRLAIGGRVAASFERAARYGSEGWVAGGMGPDGFAELMPKVRESWAAARREGEARGVALAYFTLGDADPLPFVADYYGFMGEELVETIAGSIARDPETVRAYARGFSEAGCDELIFFPAVGDPDQVDLLADA